MKPLRKAKIRLHLEALEDRLMPTTLIGGITVQMGPVVLPDWFQSNLYDAGIQTLARTEYNRDQMLTRNDMLELFAQAKIDGVVSSNEFHDLSALVAAGRSGVLAMPDNVLNLAGKVVNGDPDNATYHYVQTALQTALFVNGTSLTSIGGFHSIALGNLHAGSPAWQLTDLVNKWFLGMDLPTAETYVNGVWVYRKWGLDTQATLFGNGISYADIRQGAAGDGFFLGGVAALANQSPGTIYNNFIDNADGTYTVRFYNSDGATSYVTVNRLLPENAYGNFLYANKGQSLSDPNVKLWVALYEKAFIEANASAGRGVWHVGLGGGNSYLAFPPNPSPIVAGRGASHNNLFTDQAGFTQLVDSNQKVVCLLPKQFSSAIFSIDGFTIAPSTTYAVLGHDPASGLFTVFNPWGIANGRAADVLHLTWQQIRDIFLEYDTGSYPWLGQMAHLVTPMLQSQPGVAANSSLQIPNLQGVTFYLSTSGSPYGNELPTPY